MNGNSCSNNNNYSRNNTANPFDHPNYMSGAINANHSSDIAPTLVSNLLFIGTNQSNITNVAPQQLLFPPHQNESISPNSESIDD